MKSKSARPQEQSETLDEATVAAIKDGLESERNGDIFTLDQAVEFAKKRRKLWVKSSQSA